MSPQQRSETSSDADLVVGSHEQLWHLLAEASEIEHTLMCTYLYAAFSLKRDSDPGLQGERGRIVEAWRKSILEVATQEMVHLLLVSNLMVAVGGRPHFARPNFPISPGYFPSGVVVRLTPFSAETIDHFVFLERPPGVDATDGATFDDQSYIREQVVDGLMPSAQDYATIGHLYEGIRLNLRSLCGTIGAKALFLGLPTDQVGPDIVNLPGIELIFDLASAERAIDLIIEQGEGAAADREISHYKTFCAIRDELAALTAQDPEFAPAWPGAHSPVLRRPVDPTERVWIDDPESARLLDFACATYGLLLRLLVQCYARMPNAAHKEQVRLFEAAMVMMHTLSEAATRLARLPASPDAPRTTAGFSFTMLRGVDPLLMGQSESLFLKERIREIAGVANALSLKTATSLQKLMDEMIHFNADARR